MVIVGFLLLCPYRSSNWIDHIRQVQVKYEHKGGTSTPIATVHSTTIDHKNVVQTLRLDSCPGADATSKPIILDGGKVVIFTRHQMSRVNCLVGITVKDHKIDANELYGDNLYKLIPAKLAKKMELIPDNVQIGGSSDGFVRVNFVNRDEKDGVNTTFRVKDLKWTCLSAKPWRDPDWDGIRRF